MRGERGENGRQQFEQGRSSTEEGGGGGGRNNRKVICHQKGACFRVASPRTIPYSLDPYKNTIFFLRR